MFSMKFDCSKIEGLQQLIDDLKALESKISELPIKLSNKEFPFSYTKEIFVEIYNKPNAQYNLVSAYQWLKKVLLDSRKINDLSDLLPDIEKCIDNLEKIYKSMNDNFFKEISVTPNLWGKRKKRDGNGADCEEQETEDQETKFQLN